MKICPKQTLILRWVRTFRAGITRVKVAKQDLLTAAALRVATGNFIPVDYVPPGIEIVGTTILVLEVVGMLPYIVSHDRVETIHQRAVLVGGGNDLKLTAPVEDEPCPA